MIRKWIIPFTCLLLLIVSCNGNIEDNAVDKTAMVNFGRAVSRSIEGSNETPGAENLYWTYTAEKGDNGFKTGETEETPVKEGTGLDAEVGPFSFGKWNFTLKGYATYENGIYSNLVYEGTTSTSFSSEATYSVDVRVSYKGADGNGFLTLGEIRFNPLTSGTISSASFTITDQTYDLTKGDGNIFSYSDTLTLKSGIYSIKFTFTDNAGVERTAEKFIVILTGRMTTVSGSVSEAGAATGFKVEILKDQYHVNGNEYFVFNEESLKSALNDALKEGANSKAITIYLNKDINLIETLSITAKENIAEGASITLHLNGSTLTSDKTVIAIDSIVPVTIKNHVNYQEAAISSTGAPAVEIINGNVTITDCRIKSTAGSAIAITSGTLAMDGYSVIEGVGSAIKNDNNVNVIIGNTVIISPKETN